MNILHIVFVYLPLGILSLLLLLSLTPWGRWALYGNDEDGPYGPPYAGRPTFFEPTPWGAVRWWLRNPFHNLLFHVLSWPGGPLWRWGKRPGLNGYIGF